MVREWFQLVPHLTFCLCSRFRGLENEHESEIIVNTHIILDDFKVPLGGTGAFFRRLCNECKLGL